MEFHTPDGSAVLTCSLNGAAFTACASPLTVTTVYNTTSSFAVHATDQAGKSAITHVVDLAHRPGPALSVGAGQHPQHQLARPGSAVQPRWHGHRSGGRRLGRHRRTRAERAQLQEHDPPAQLIARRHLHRLDLGARRLGLQRRHHLLDPGERNGITLALAGRQVNLTVNESGKAFTTTTVIPQEQWVQIGLQTTGPAKGLQLIINGAVVGSVTPPSVTGFGPGQLADLTVGPIFDVDLDDLRFYNRALGGSELCTTLVRGVLDANGGCTALIPGFELSFEKSPIRDTGNWTLAFTAPQSANLVPTHLGTGLQLPSSGQAFGYTQGFASRVTQVTRPSRSRSGSSPAARRPTR